MITVSLRYGTARLNDIAVDEGSTVDDVKDVYSTALGLPEATQALVNNEPEGDEYVLEDGDSVTFEKKACGKAA